MSRLKQTILAAKKNREKYPRPVAKLLRPIGTGKMKQHSQQNLEVLCAIESALVRCFMDDDRVDDAVVLTCLRSVILEDPPQSMPHAWIYSELMQAFVQCGANAEIFYECLRVVMDSVTRRSKLRAGEISYLEFVSQMLELSTP